MEIRGEKLVFTQPEVVHILWTHNSTPSAPQDSDRVDFINEIATNYSKVRQSDSKNGNVIIDNIPESRELLAKRILRQERPRVEDSNTSTDEQVAAMQELHRLGRTATARMARRVFEYELRRQQESTD